jgi:hypothetical protein
MILRSKTIDIPIYGGKLSFYYDSNLTPIKEQYNLDINLDDYDAFVFSDNSKDEFIICFSEYKFSTAVHEIIHVVNDIFKSRNIELDLDNDEPQAYLAGWVAKELNTFMNEFLRSTI